MRGTDWGQRKMGHNVQNLSTPGKSSSHINDVINHEKRSIKPKQSLIKGCSDLYIFKEV